MPYSERITRITPACFLFLIDQSGSMKDPIAGSGGAKSKADTLVDCVNKILKSTIIRSTKDDGVRDYFYISVIGYGDKVGPAFSGALAGQELVAISKIANNPARIEERKKKEDDGAGGIYERKIKFPIWFDAVSVGRTPMCQAFELAEKILTKWLSQHQNSFPPIVINITDGESTDGNPSVIADRIKALHSQDGNVLLFNLHLSAKEVTSENPRPLFGVAPLPLNSMVIFPDEVTSLPDNNAQLLFNMSSLLPLNMREMAKSYSYRVSEKTRGFGFNADLESVVNFLDIGTSTAPVQDR